MRSFSMRMLSTLFLVAVMLSAAACSPAAQQAPTTAPTTAPSSGQTDATQQAPTTAPTTAPSSGQTDATQVPVADTEEGVYLNTAITSLPLVNARTGETFTLASFEGKVIYVEPMATWCTNCRAQLGRVREVYEQLDASQFVFVGISVETNISAADLAMYADNQNFPWLFAVASRDMLAALDAEYGSVILTPPQTPHFIINPNGTLSQLYTGAHAAGDVTTLLQQAAGA
jgi:peroxiredoxin